jgi:hypothetical protein
MTATDRARALLLAATIPKGSSDPQQWRDWAKANQELNRLGFNKPATLAVAAQGFEALYVAHDFCCDFEDDQPCTTENCQVQKALAAWEALFKKEETNV